MITRTGTSLGGRVVKWYEKPVRMMRWDCIGEYEKVKEMDLDAWAREKRATWHVNCEWIVGAPGAAPGTGNLTTFSAEGFERYPGFENFDFLREYLPYARKHGIKLLVYLNMHWYSYDFAAEHPDWEQRMATGESYGRTHPLYGNGTTFCVNSQWRDWAFALIRETAKTGVDGIFLDGPVIFPDCCYCKYCQKKFEKRYGKPLPKEDWLDETWKDFLEFREDSMAEFLKDAQKSLKEINPEQVIFLNAGGWQASGWRVARDIQKVGKFQDFNGAEAFFHPHPGEYNLYDTAIMAKYLVAGGKPAVVFTHYALGLWHYNFLPPWEIKLAIAQTVACGANPWFAFFNKAYEHAPAGVEPVEQIQRFLEENEEYYTAAKSEATVAILSSAQSSTFYISELAELYRDLGTGKEQDLIVDLGTGKTTIDWGKRKRICEGIQGSSFLGYCMALLRDHVPFDVILDKCLTKESLSRYEALILPNAACLSDQQIGTIKEFVKKGGKLIGSFETGFYDERGRKRAPYLLDELLGIQTREGVFPATLGENYMKAKQDYFAFAKGSLLPRGPYCLKIKAKEGTKTPIAFLEPIPRVYMPLTKESEYPALIINRFGKGISAYFPQLIGSFYANYKIEDTQRLISHTVKGISRNIPLEVEAPPTVQVELYSQEKPRKRFVIHLVNNGGDMQRPVSQIVPVENIKIRVKTGATQKVYTLTKRKEIGFNKMKGWTEFPLPKLDFYEVVVAE